MWAEWWAYELQALVAGWVGTEGLAAHVAGANVVTAVFMVAIGIQQATSTLVGFSIGNQKPKNAKEIAIVSIVFTTGLIRQAFIPWFNTCFCCSYSMFSH